MQLIAEVAAKDRTLFSPTELQAVRDCIKQNPELEDVYVKLKHTIFTAMTTIGVALRKDPNFHLHFPEVLV
jgi:hypothetical protein